MKKKLRVVCQLGVLILWCAIPVAAQEASSDDVNQLRKEIETLKEGQKSIQKDLQEIKSLLRPRQAPAPAPTPTVAPAQFVLDVGENPFKGEPSAKLTLVEFTDYQ
ncbi:MAG: hypothetical protein V3R94_01540 [Acidobacteriota bacterium]